MKATPCLYNKWFICVSSVHTTCLRTIRILRGDISLTLSFLLIGWTRMTHPPTFGARQWWTNISHNSRAEYIIHDIWKSLLQMGSLLKYKLLSNTQRPEFVVRKLIKHKTLKVNHFIKENLPLSCRYALAPVFLYFSHIANDSSQSNGKQRLSGRAVFSQSTHSEQAPRIPPCSRFFKWGTVQNVMWAV